MNFRTELLYNRVFILSLAILALNDHVLKGIYHNWLTGKISDFAGLIVLPLFIAFLIPRLSRWSCHIAAACFIFWKSEFSTDFIELLNQNGLFTFSRVVDYTDLMALLILPLSWRLIHQKSTDKPRSSFGLSFIAVSTFLVLTATTLPKPSTLEPSGTILIDQTHPLKVPKDTVLARIRQLGYDYTLEDNFYKIRDIVVPEIVNGRKYRIKQDTIKELTFTFLGFPYQPSKRQEKLGAQYLYIHEVKFSDVNTITDWRLMRKYSKLYHRFSKELFAKEATGK